jgi:hypothetical protein
MPSETEFLRVGVSRVPLTCPKIRGFLNDAEAEIMLGLGVKEEDRVHVDMPLSRAFASIVHEVTSRLRAEQIVLIKELFNKGADLDELASR